MANNIVIKISSDNSGSGVTANQTITTSNQPTKASNTPNKAGENNVVSSLTKMLIVDQGKKVLNNVISQFGNLTGNSIASARIQNLSTLAGYGTTIAVGGWVGAIGVAVDVGIQAVNNVFELRKTNNQLELLRTRVGNSAINGSR